MAGYVKGSEAERKMKIRRHKEWMILRGLLVEGFDLETAELIMDKPYIYLKNLIDEFSPIADIEELVY